MAMRGRLAGPQRGTSTVVLTPPQAMGRGTQEGVLLPRGAAQPHSRDVTEAGWRAGVPTHPTQYLLSMNMYQARSGCRGAIGEPDYSPCGGGFTLVGDGRDFSLSISFCVTGDASAGMSTAGRLESSGWASFMPPRTQHWAAGKVNAQ